MKRRQFFAVPAAVALAACAQGNGAPSQTPAQVIADLQIIGTALTNDLVVLGILPADARAKIQTAVATIGAITQKVASGAQDGASGVQQVYAAVQTILDASSAYTSLLPKQWVDGIAAAQTLLPVLALLVGINLAPPAPAAATLPKPAPAQARAMLTLHAGRQ